ncbi:unnamed protein product, partial [Symbiodinium necroappetens]
VDDLPEISNGLAGFQRIDAYAKEHPADPAKPSQETISAMTKLMDSTVAKISKLRSLAKELRKKYKADDETKKHTSGLEVEIKSMEQQYDKCCELKAKAENQMDEELYKQMEICIKEVTIVPTTQVLAILSHGDENQDSLAPYPWPKVSDEKLVGEAESAFKQTEISESEKVPKCPELVTNKEAASIKSTCMPILRSKALLGHLQESPGLCEMYNQCTALGCISFNVPSPNAIAGKVLQHCVKEIDITIATKKPLIFKVGFTHNPVWRWSNDLYGYNRARDGWTDMTVMYISDEHFGPAMLEAALIDKYNGHLQIGDPYGPQPGF